MTTTDANPHDNEAQELFDKRLGEVTAADLEELFRRTKEQGYEARQRSLSAAENKGEAAIVVDPIESPLWYVASRDGYLSNPENPQELLRVAQEVIEWTNEVVSAERRVVNGNGANGHTNGDIEAPGEVESTLPSAADAS
jgi:hypothetical protein